MEEPKIILEKYQSYLKTAKIKIKVEVWIAISFAVALLFAAAAVVLTRTFNSMPLLTSHGIAISPIFIGIMFFVGLDLMLGYPYLKNMQRIESVEENLPEALKQIADTLKAGATYEYALREIASSSYGPLSVEIENVLRKLEDGENLENSLKSLSTNVDSRFVQRTVTIINDSIKAGAGLAEILDDISDDLRELKRIARERKTKTLMQMIFIVAAGAFVTPMILGFVSTLVSFLINVAAYGLSIAKEELEAIIATKNSMIMLTQIYLAIEIIASSIIISLMREGKIAKSIIYAPILLLIGYIIYYIAAIFSALMIGTGA